jgi:hypothetical protein
MAGGELVGGKLKAELVAILSFMLSFAFALVAAYGDRDEKLWWAIPVFVFGFIASAGFLVLTLFSIIRAYNTWRTSV